MSISSGTSRRISTYPFKDSAIVYWDSGPIRDDPVSGPGGCAGHDPPPLENVPNRTGEDPHGLPRKTLAGAADGLRLPAPERD